MNNDDERDFEEERWQREEAAREAEAEWASQEQARETFIASRPCPTKTPEEHLLGEFPMTCYNCHVHADS